MTIAPMPESRRGRLVAGLFVGGLIGLAFGYWAGSAATSAAPVSDSYIPDLRELLLTAVALVVSIALIASFLSDRRHLAIAAALSVFVLGTMTGQIAVRVTAAQ